MYFICFLIPACASIASEEWKSSTGIEKKDSPVKRVIGEDGKRGLSIEKGVGMNVTWNWIFSSSSFARILFCFCQCQRDFLFFPSFFLNNWLFYLVNFRLPFFSCVFFFFSFFFPAFFFFVPFLFLNSQQKNEKLQNLGEKKRFDRFAFIGWRRRRSRSRSASSRSSASSFASIGRFGQLGTGQSNFRMIFSFLFSSSFLLISFFFF